MTRRELKRTCEIFAESVQDPTGIFSQGARDQAAAINDAMPLATLVHIEQLFALSAKTVGLYPAWAEAVRQAKEESESNK